MTCNRLKVISDCIDMVGQSVYLKHYVKHELLSVPSVRRHGTLAMIMANLAKSWLTMVPLSRYWQIMIH